VRAVQPTTLVAPASTGSPRFAEACPVPGRASLAVQGRGSTGPRGAYGKRVRKPETRARCPRGQSFPERACNRNGGRGGHGKEQVRCHQHNNFYDGRSTSPRRTRPVWSAASRSTKIAVCWTAAEFWHVVCHHRGLELSLRPRFLSISLSSLDAAGKYLPFCVFRCGKKDQDSLKWDPNVGMSRNVARNVSRIHATDPH